MEVSKQKVEKEGDVRIRGRGVKASGCETIANGKHKNNIKAIV
jgi:hypothetical protein